MQGLEEQVNTVERALGERMIGHALLIIRAWMNELGETNPFEQAYADISEQNNALFSDWLVSDSEEYDRRLDELTGDTYRLADAAYVALRLARGISPRMKGYNPSSAPSVMHYFSRCLELTDADYAWLHDAVNDSDRASYALIAVAALSKNLRECFSERAMLALFDGMNGSNAVTAEQCVANAILLLAHYDVRIDFFPNIQDAFVEALNEMDDDGKQAFETMCALVRSVNFNWIESYASGEMTYDDLPEELRGLLEMTGSKDDISGVSSWMPSSENEYMSGIVNILPNTWIFEVLVNESQSRINVLTALYLSVGSMELAWDRTEVAEAWLVKRLRSGKGKPLDYIHYGHCLMLKGDRMMAFENYRTAREKCKSVKEFYALFRPERRQLVDRGIPVEQIYFIEDQLLSIS